MRLILRSVMLTLLAFFSMQAFAGLDPIGWRMNRSFQDPALVGRTYTVIYTFTNNLPFKLVKPIIIQKNATPASEFSYVDGCSGLKLNHNQSCTVQVTLAPTVNGAKSIQLAITGYDNNRAILPTQTVTAQGGQLTTGVYETTTQSLPNSLSAGQPGKYIFTFTNGSQTVAATGISINVTQTSGTPTYTTSNCTSPLSVGGVCTVSGTYTPTTNNPSLQEVTATFSYAQGSPVSGETDTSISSSTGVRGFFVGNNYLPPVMVGGPANKKTIIVNFFNHGPGSATVTGTGPGQPISITVGGGSGTLTNVSGCASLTLLEGQGCDVTGDFEADVAVTPTSMAVTAEVGYTMLSGGGPQTASLITSTTVVSALSLERTLTITNKCNFPVWFSLNGGEVGAATSCSTDADCDAVGTGAACSPITKKCFWKNYGPGGPDQFNLTQNQTKTVTIPATTFDPAIQWSGNISASTRCNGSTACLQADCLNHGGSTACTQGKGFFPPATQAEITMQKFAADSYDVEVINGFHIPISMAPGPYVSADNYSCGTPGQFAAGNNFGACNWETAATPGSGYFWVTNGTKACNVSAPSGCGSTQICGINSSFQQMCGDFFGYWTANQLCSYPALPATLRAYFSCDTPLSQLTSGGVTFPKGAILYDLMACSVVPHDKNVLYNSCYLTYPSVPANGKLPCCGCMDWWTVPGIGANPTSTSCAKTGKPPQTDPAWNGNVQNGVAWLKKACPSSYVYPFDDKTSSFVCTNNSSSGRNSVGYTITFCEGNAGLPAGKTDGRIPPV